MLTSSADPLPIALKDPTVAANAPPGVSSRKRTLMLVMLTLIYVGQAHDHH